MGLLQTFPKAERLHSNKLINGLFSGGGSRAMTEFPLRMVYKTVEGVEPCQVLISVPKRCLHRANKRNRVKRQLREAYRRHKDMVAGRNLLIAFIWLDSNIYPTDVVEQRVVSLLTRACEKLDKK